MMEDLLEQKQGAEYESLVLSAKLWTDEPQPDAFLGVPGEPIITVVHTCTASWRNGRLERMVSTRYEP